MKYTSKIKTQKNLIITVIIASIIALIIFTIDIIRETENWKLFDIDFENKNQIISAYGSLIGGILAFLSILLVLYSLLEQRQQNLSEKILKEQDQRSQLFDKLKLLSTLFKSTIDDILIQGENLNDYYKSEIESPIEMNRLFFTSNRNFKRIIEMDSLSTYKAIRTFFKDQNDWEKIFLDIYDIFDFYSKSLTEFRKIYDKHYKRKIKEHRKISLKLRKFFKICRELTKEYESDLLKNDLENEWLFFISDFTSQYYRHLEDFENQLVDSNLRIISDNFLLPFMDESFLLRKKIGNEKPQIEILLQLASDIRKDIFITEKDSLEFAQEINLPFETFFKSDSKILNDLRKLKHKLDSITN